MDLPAPSDGKVTPLDENDTARTSTIMFIFQKNMKAGSHASHKSGHQQQAKRVKPVVTSILKKTSPTFLNSDLDFGNNFTDTILMGLVNINKLISTLIY